MGYWENFSEEEISDILEKMHELEKERLERNGGVQYDHKTEIELPF